MEGPRTFGVCGWAMANNDSEVAKERAKLLWGPIFSISENLACTFQQKAPPEAGLFK